MPLHPHALVCADPEGVTGGPDTSSPGKLQKYRVP